MPLPSAALASMVYPPPPPTTNTLTWEQRAQLRKSAKKLKQILGATPHLIDTDIVGILGPVHVQLPSRSETPPFSSDSDSARSSSSCSFYPNHPYATCIALENEEPPSRQTSFLSKPSPPAPAPPSSPSPSASQQAPVLRLNTISSPPPTARPSSPSCSSSSATCCDSDDSSFFSSSPPHSPSSTTSPDDDDSSSPLSKTSTKFNLITSHTRSKSVDGFFSSTTDAADTANHSDMRFFLHPTRHSTAIEPSDYHHPYHLLGGDSAVATTTPTPSASSSSTAARRQKMNRLRKMLGAEVPVHLVFPDTNVERDEEEKWERGVGTGDRVSTLSVTHHDERPGLNSPRATTATTTTPIVRDPMPVASSSVTATTAVAGAIVIPRPPRKSSVGKIMGARDSMGNLSPHRAKRQEKQNAEQSLSPSSWPSSSKLQHPFSTSTVPSSPSSVTPLRDFTQKQLCVIVESPDEHGSSPFEGFGFGGRSCAHTTTTTTTTATTTMKSATIVVESKWRVSSSSAPAPATSIPGGSAISFGDGANKMWNTRRGYTGWDRPQRSGQTVMVTTTTAAAAAAASTTTTTTTTATAGAAVPPAVTASVAATDMPRKKSMSYRKPPPPIDF